MSRRWVAALPLVLVVLLAACDSTTVGAHWQGQPGQIERHIIVAIDPQYSSPGFNAAVTQGTGVWSISSPYVELHPIVGWCQSGQDCISVYRAPISGAVASVGWDGNLHIHGWGGSMGFDNRPFSQADMEFLVCHETGHMLGLLHGDLRSAPCYYNGWPTPTDLALIALTYNHTDG